MRDVGFRLKALLMAIILVLTFVAMPFSFSYWLKGLGGASSSDYLRFMVGYLDGTEDDQSDRLQGVPQVLVDKLNDIKDDLSPYELEMMIEALEAFARALTDYQGYLDKNLFLDVSADKLFENYKEEEGVVGQGSVLIFLHYDEDTGRKEVLFVHIHEDFTFAGQNTISDAATLWSALSASYSNIYAHNLSNVYMHGNRYTRRHAPVMIGNRDGSGEESDYYLFLGNGWGDYPPDTGGEWRKVLKENYEHDPFNRSYFEDAIVMQGGNYYIANQMTWSPPPSWGWTQISQYNGTSVNVGTVVYTLKDDGLPRFWRVTKANVTSAPSVTSAQAGDWRELDNRWGWVGDTPGNTVIRSHYLEHNHYDEGDIIIYGISPSFRYRYYRAVKSVPQGQSPLIYVDGSTSVKNTEYWEAIYNYDN